MQGGYRIAKMMGWMKSNEYSAVWTYEELEISDAKVDVSTAVR